MATYEFSGELFDTELKMHEAIAGEWLSGGGWNDRDQIERAFMDCSDRDLAKEAYEGWNLEENPQVDYEELVTAFSEIRADPAVVFGWADGED